MGLIARIIGGEIKELLVKFQGLWSLLCLCSHIAREFLHLSFSQTPQKLIFAMARPCQGIALFLVCLFFVGWIGYVPAAMAEPSKGIALPTIDIATDIAQPMPLSVTTAWNYDAQRGPSHWADLDPSYGLCATGQAQSPIDLAMDETGDDFADASLADLLPKLTFHYEPAPLNIMHTGYGIQVPYAPGSYLSLGEQRYDLRQFHFHSPSEHAINGQLWAGELHLVHQNESGQLAVVAVLLQSGSSRNQASAMQASFAKLSRYLPGVGEKVRTGEWMNARSLLPANTSTYRYQGSLTTPPCSESVTWLVLSEPVNLSAEQIAQYQSLLNHNNRPLQPRHQRPVQLSSIVGRILN
jgi:carbonic anhydrase